MARISDVPHVVREIGLFGLVKRVLNQINEDLVFTWAAALAYSWMFAVFPFFIFMLTLAPYLPYNAKDTAIREVNEFIDKSMPREAANTLKENVEKVMSEPRGGLLSVGLLVTIWAAAGGISMTMSALDIAYDIDKTRPWWRQRLVAIGLTVVVAVLILSVMLLLPIGTIALKWVAAQGTVFKPVLWLINIVRYALALVLLFAVLALIYYFGPSLRTKFHAVTPGAVFAIAVWLLLGLVFRFYVNKFGSYDQTYGTIGGVVVLLFVFYIDAVVLLVGAEINSEIDFVSLGLPSSPAEAPQEAAAHAAPMDEEKEALARELQSKRREDLGVNPIGRPAGPALAAGGAGAGGAGASQNGSGGGGMNKVLLALSTLGVALLVDRLRQRSKRNAVRITEPKRLREMYPVTYAALKREDTANGHEREQ